MASLSGAMPSTAVYLLSPRLIAATAASLMLSGTSKSGSPAPSPMTSRPAAFRARALSVTAMVAEGLMRPIESAKKAMHNSSQKPHSDHVTCPAESGKSGQVMQPMKFCGATHEWYEEKPIPDPMGAMAGLIQTLRSGDWLIRERIMVVSAAVLIAAAVALAFLIATANGFNDFKGRPLGTDFSSFYAAGTFVLDGQPTEPFDPSAHHRREQAIFGAATPFYSFSYPPIFLFVAAALALMPYPLALVVWQGTTLGLYLAAMWRIVGWIASRRN